MGLLQVSNLSTYYSTSEGNNQAVKDVSFDLREGEMLGLIGESGCGKSTVGYSTINMIQYPGKIITGTVSLLGRNILIMDDKQLRKVLWKEIAMIPQSAMNALNPSHKIGNQIVEVIRLHNHDITKKQAEDKAKELLCAVGIDEKWYCMYPHKLSGGMKQRVIIAMTLSCDPKVIISDESTTGLDVLIQAQILALLKKLQKERGIGIILISHDLQMVTSICERIGIMYAGNLVEIANTEEISTNPKHPYTRALFSSQIDIRDLDKKVESIEGIVPKLINPDNRCRFYSRCTEKIEICRGTMPMMKQISKGHSIACYLEGRYE